MEYTAAEPLQSLAGRGALAPVTVMSITSLTPGRRDLLQSYHQISSDGLDREDKRDMTDDDWGRR
jgi:hypothetical protein